MSVQMTQARFITRPQTTPLTSTLFHHVTPVVVDHFGVMKNDGLWPSYNCLDTLVPTAMCPDPLVEASGNIKEFGSAPWVPGFEFAVYAGVGCNLIGLDVADQDAELKRVFEANQSKGVERALRDVRFVASDSDAPVEWDAPTDLTPGDISLTVALALLEGDAADKYAGLPIIHMPRAAGTILESHGLITWDGDKAFTKNGSEVAMGGGYDDETMLASGSWDLYATGEVYVEMSEQIDISVNVVPGDGNGIGSDETGIHPNTHLVLAERMFRVGVDCYLAKATGKVFTP